MKIKNGIDRLKICKPLILTKICKPLILTEESGSAVVEFVLLAIPLFVPLSYFLVNVANHVSVESQARNLARQSVRAYVSAPNEEVATGRINAILDNFRSQRQVSESISQNIGISLVCSESPCLSTGGIVKAVVSVPSDGLIRGFEVSVSESVDDWR